MQKEIVEALEYASQFSALKYAVNDDTLNGWLKKNGLTTIPDTGALRIVEKKRFRSENGVLQQAQP